MKTAKLFKHGGSQAVRLPKEFRLPGKEVMIEKRGDEIVLRPVSQPDLRTLADVARHLAARFGPIDFPDVERPKEQQKRDLTW